MLKNLEGRREAEMASPRFNHDGSFVARIPGVARLAAFFARLRSTPGGFLVLLPIAIALDVFDVVDELALGPVGMAIAFVVESAFLLGVTGRSSYALALAGIDLVPGLDVLPLATIALVREYLRAGRDAPAGVGGPVIDVRASTSK